MSASYNYEIMMVFSVANGEEGANALLAKFKGMIEANGTVDNVDVWGKRKLEYLINDEAEGFYVVISYQSAPEFQAELDRVLKITDGVLRTMIIRK
jgi:small subunit ribosomal protein S6